LRRRDFRNLWLGQMVSTIGAEIAVVAVPFQVYKLTGSTALVGLLRLACIAGCVVTAFALPRFLNYDAQSDPQPA
jgi:hypothetical protein